MYTITENINRLKEHLMLSEIKGVGTSEEAPTQLSFLFVKRN